MRSRSLTRVCARLLPCQAASAGEPLPLRPQRRGRYRYLTPRASIANSVSTPRVDWRSGHMLTRLQDTVVLNPPFGTMVKGIDMVFLEVATLVRLASSSPPSLTIDRRLQRQLSTHCTRRARENISSKRRPRWDLRVKCWLRCGYVTLLLDRPSSHEVQYDLPKTYAHHKAKTVDIQVDLFRFSRIVPRPSSAL